MSGLISVAEGKGLFHLHGSCSLGAPSGFSVLVLVSELVLVLPCSAGMHCLKLISQEPLSKRVQGTPILDGICNQGSSLLLGSFKFNAFEMHSFMELSKEMFVFSGLFWN